jgi:hypothetical protein
MNTPSAKKTWAEVIKSGGINVQIVLGNGNLGLTTLTMKRGERRGGAARRLMKRGENGERGATGRGKGGPEEIISGGNKGGQKGKNGRGRGRIGRSPARWPLSKPGSWTRQRVVDLKHEDIGELRPHTLRTVVGQSPVGA